MAITIKNEEEIELMRKAGQMLARVHVELAKELKEGMTTKDVDRLAEEMILSFGGYPNFKGYNGFPAAACVSVNDEVVHGIPSDKRYLRSGDIVSIDTGVLYKGYHSDAARTHAIGEVDKDVKKLIRVTEESFFAAIKKAKPGSHIVDIGQVVQRYALKYGYSVVRSLTGHGIGTDLHEAPNVPNYKTLFKGARLRKGMTLAVEPMINMGNYGVELLENNWTYATSDGTMSSHYENTIAITDEGCEILTMTPEEISARLEKKESAAKKKTSDIVIKVSDFQKKTGSVAQKTGGIPKKPAGIPKKPGGMPKKAADITEDIVEDTNNNLEIPEEVSDDLKNTSEISEKKSEETKITSEVPEVVLETSEIESEDLKNSSEITEEVSETSEIKSEDLKNSSEITEEVLETSENEFEDSMDTSELTEEVSGIAEKGTEDPKNIPETSEEVSETPEIESEDSKNTSETSEETPNLSKENSSVPKKASPFPKKGSPFPKKDPEGSKEATEEQKRTYHFKKLPLDIFEDD